MRFTKNQKFFFVFLGIIVFIIDQLTKYFIKLNYEFLVNKEFFLFKLDLVKNYGAAFNILSGNRIFLSIFSFLITIILVYLILRKNISLNTELYGYSFILGGTLGNGVDRIIKGYVLDFINLNFISFPVFNIADISINIGFFFILYTLVKEKK